MICVICDCCGQIVDVVGEGDTLAFLLASKFLKTDFKFWPYSERNPELEIAAVSEG